ncbi:MAG TPA: host attachment protein [Pseudomonadales bacterium]
MAQTWLIVADGARARFFERRSASDLSEFDVMISPEGRSEERSLHSDRPGRSFDSRGDGRHAMEPAHSARDHEAEAFAKRVCKRLDEARLAGSVDKLVLIAPPRFLGHLRASLSKGTQGIVAHSIDKELTQASPDEIAEHIPGVL